MGKGKVSVGILAYRRRKEEIEVFLVHPGGPFWQKKDEHVWSIPKGEPDEGEDYLEAALREMKEETGLTVNGSFRELTPIRQAGGKRVYAFAVEADLDPDNIKSNLFVLEWPPHSRRQQQFPEVDKAGWFSLDVARKKINKGQVALLDELERLLTATGPGSSTG